MNQVIKVLLISVIVLIIIILGTIAWFIYKSQEDNTSDSCTELGCQAGAVYVGSINSDKYYECDCHYAKQINPENIVCFSSDENAEADGRVKSEC